MAIGLTALILGLIAAGAAGTTGAASIGMNNKNKRNQEEVLKRIRESGYDTVPQTNAEILRELENFRDPTKTNWFESLAPSFLDADYYTSGADDYLKELGTAQNFLSDPNNLALIPEQLNPDLVKNEIKDRMLRDQSNMLGEIGGVESRALGDIQGTYDTYRKDMLQQQNLNRGQIMNAYQNTFRDQRTRAIEAGASAGLKLANNVNALLSAQNTQRATSLETSNQLANMALQQQNAASQTRSEANRARLDLAERYNEENMDTAQRTGLFNRMNENEVIRNYGRDQLANRADALDVSQSTKDYIIKKAGSSGFKGYTPLSPRR
jgi:hypothetical protein